KSFVPYDTILKTSFDLSVFINVKVSSSRATFEWCRTVAHQSFSVSRKIYKSLWQLAEELLKYLSFLTAQRQLTFIIVNKQNAWDKDHLLGKREHLFSVLWGACTENATNNNSKTGILTEPWKAFL